MNESNRTPEFAALTDIGLVREENQDNYGFLEALADEPEKGRLLLVCDGMGGERGGGTASRLAVEIILEHFKSATGGDSVQVLQESFYRASEGILAQAHSNGDLLGMGTTATAVLIQGSRAQVVHVGDSRAYLLRGGQITQLTVDHTWVQEMISRGMITPEEARTHPNRNVLTQALGTEGQLVPVTLPEPLQLGRGDVLLLCSDGLSGLVQDREMLECVERAQTLKESCAELVELAKQRGGHDNITVLLWRCPE